MDIVLAVSFVNLLYKTHVQLFTGRDLVGRSPTFAYCGRLGTKPAQFLYRRIMQYVNEL